MLDSKPFRLGLWILLILLIFLVGSEVSYLFRPVAVVVQALFFPLFFSGLLYYLTRPLVSKLTAKKLPRSLAILLVYLLLGGILAVFIVITAPLLQREITRLIKEAPILFEELGKLLVELRKLEPLQQLETEWIEDLGVRFANIAQHVFSMVYANISAFLQLLGNILLAFVTVPFILYYLLKEDYKVPQFILKYVPEEEAVELREVMSNINWAISSYIQGQAIVCFSVGSLALIGYMIIGLDYALLLALFAMLTNVIPYLGPIIGAVPALLVGALDSPLMALQVLIVVIVVQQLESMVIAPQVIGRKLQINPVIIILLILAAGHLAGFLGMILAVPSFAVARIIAAHLYELIKKKKKGTH